MIKVSIIVCAFNEELRIKDCLESIKPQIFNNFEYELLIIDNESSDKTEIICNKFVEESKSEINIRYMRIKHVALSKSRNLGISNTTGDKIIFIDADAKADKNWLVEILTGFESPKVDIVSGKIRNLNSESSFAQFIYKAHFESLVLEDKTQVLKQGASNMVGANMAFKRIVFDKIGGFFDHIQYRGDETAVVTAYFQMCPERREKYVSTSIVYNEHATNLSIWLGQQYSEGKSYANILSITNQINIKNHLKSLVRAGNIIFLFLFPFSIFNIVWLIIFSVFPLVRYGYRYKFILKSFIETKKELGFIKAILTFPTIIIGTIALDLGYLKEIFSFKQK
ncbi:MAG: hypothetical protein DRG78_02725 [Epsilonproteobacteria bacterium]|nr:MAG: hypothetical protein DRG78_02725 [Campylobacterota bacterium]